MNGQPLSYRKFVRVLVALMILAWATQTLLHQWARGQEAPASATAGEPVISERFVPGTDRTAAGGTLEMRAEATVHAGDVKLRQVCRWSEADAGTFAPLADLIIMHCEGNKPFQAVSLDEIRRTLHDAGVNLALIRFAGAATCTISRSDVQFDERAALQEWIAAKQGKAPPGTPTRRPTTQPLAGQEAPGQGAIVAADLHRPASAEPPVRSLRDLLLADAAVRLAIPAESLQVNFSPADEKVLNLSEPQFKFNLTARSVHNLGDVSWDVLIVTEAGNKKIPLSATARAWQEQVVLVRPVAYRQIIQISDFTERRVLADRLPEDVLLTPAQVLGQESSRELKPGVVLTARMVSPVALAKPGQFVTVTLSQGNVRVKTVARAMESGSFGQTIKVKNEATRENYEVVLTGPQEGSVSPVETKSAQ